MSRTTPPGPDPPSVRTGLGKRVWRSIFRGPIVPRTDRDRNWVVFNTLVLHLRPLRVPARTLKYTHTFGLGGSSLVLVTVLMATGLLLMFAYEPVPGAAYDSIVTLEDEVLFGRLVRGVHHWCANLVIVVVLLHLLRVFFTGAYHGPRQFNWIVGLTLLACVLTSNFTGYLLPWDQLSYWAITISTGMVEYVPGIGPSLQQAILGGPEIGSATVINFYTFHTTVVPVLLIVLMALHFWRVRKAGGVVFPRGPDETLPEGKPETVLFLPNLLVRETAVALILVALVLVLAILFPAPLGDRANPGMSPNPAKAPWYFQGFQELLVHFHPVFAVLVLPLLAGLALLAVPYLRYDAEMEGTWLLSRKGRRMGIVAAATAAVITPAWIVLGEYVVDLGSWMAAVPPLVSTGLVPFAILLAGVLAFRFVVGRRFGPTRAEAVQTMFILLFTGFVVLTAVSVWFRGSGMALTWP